MGLINNLINKIFPLPTLYIRLYKNQIEVKHIESGVVINRKASVHFSNDRLLIADFDCFENFLREIIKEVLGNKKIIRTTKVLLQPVDKIITKITPVELRVYQDSLEYSGASFIFIYEYQNRLSDIEVINLLGKNII